MLFALGNCFYTAGKKMDINSTFDFVPMERNYVKVGKPGLKIHTLLASRSLAEKANRELIIAYRNLMPIYNGSG